MSPAFPSSTREDIGINEYLHTWSASVVKVSCFWPMAPPVMEVFGGYEEARGRKSLGVVFLSSRVGQQFRLAF